MIAGGLTAVFGVLVLVRVFAAGTPIAFETESGTLASGAAVASVTGQSGSGAVKFGSGSTGTNPLASLPLIAWEGGAGYYNAYSGPKEAGWAASSFFPIGAWYMPANSQSDIDVYKSLGITTSVKMETNANLPLLKSNGMFAFPDAGSAGAGG